LKTLYKKHYLGVRAKKCLLAVKNAALHNILTPSPERIVVMFFKSHPNRSEVSRQEGSFVAGNYFDKYQSRNFVHRHLMQRFLADVGKLVRLASPRSIMEAGCGSADLTPFLLEFAGEGVSYFGVDLSAAQIAMAQQKHADHKFAVANIYELPVEDEAVDLVVACEVLEHVDDPERAASELARVTNSWVLVSVPWEPVWRILNFLRGKYMTSLGNTPGHVQHFTRKRIRSLMSKHYTIVAECRPLPWTVLLLKKKIE